MNISKLNVKKTKKSYTQYVDVRLPNDVALLGGSVLCATYSLLPAGMQATIVFGCQC